MTNSDVEKKINMLRKEIEKHNKYYYDESISKISDNEYDSLVQDLIDLERKYPNFVTEDSPTQKVSGMLNRNFEKYEHLIPMLSLTNAFNLEELRKFDERNKKATNKKNIKYYCEYKIDGLSIALEYRNGKLINAATRGDGKFGENILTNILQINSIPKTINYKDDLLVRGEIFFTNEQFKIINMQREENNEKLFANSRNAASGTLRQLNSETVKTRNLSLFCYFVHKKNSFETHKEDLDFLLEHNFPVNNQYNKLLDSIEKVIDYVELLTKKRNELDYNVDGIVIKVNDHDLQNLIGETSKFPKWAIAYKFEAIRAMTILENIFPTVGRTGKITYNAMLKPVQLSGSIIKAATLHNADYIIKNDIRIGDYVLIKKAGDIIPKVIQSVIEKRSPEVYSWEVNTECPDCKQTLIKHKNGVDQYCVNTNCYKRFLRKMEHFVSKQAMNIQGLSKKIITKLYELKIISSYSSLYELKKYEKEILSIDKMGKKLFDNIINSIEKSKKVSLENFIFAIGIPTVGFYIATLLAKQFKKIQKLFNVSEKSLLEIIEIGSTITKNILDFFQDPNNIAEIKRMILLGVDIYYNEVNNKFNNTVFVFTGKLNKNRSFYVKEIRQNGGRIASTVSNNINYLVVGEEPGHKYVKAKSLDLKIITEAELEKLLWG